jgi:hypothetical protein
MEQHIFCFPAIDDHEEAGQVRVSSAICLASIQSVKLRRNIEDDKFKDDRFSPFRLHRQILQALASWPENITLSMNLLTIPEPAFPLGGKVEIAIVITVSGTDRQVVITDLISRCANLYALLATFLDGAEFEIIPPEDLKEKNSKELKRWLKPLQPKFVYNIDRFLDSFTLAKETLKASRKEYIGFLSSSTSTSIPIAGVPKINYLFPWHQERDSDLAMVLEALLFHPAPIWLQVRLRPALVSAVEKAVLEESLTVCEELISGAYSAQSILSVQTKALREAISERMWQQNRQAFHGGCFLCSESALDDALVTAVAHEISSMPNVKDQPYLPLNGGVSITPLAVQNFLNPDYFSQHGIMTVDEAACAFRIPWPEKIDPQGLPIKTHRTGLIDPVLLHRNTSDMLLLGSNRHSGHINPVRVSDEDRMLHTCVMGQTGTGKSVFLESMILQDIAKGKGVCFIDPHGDSVEKILQLYPEKRIDDLVLIDFLDRKRVIPFNLLAYRDVEERDRIIDDLYGWLDLTYDLKITGGPIFEMYFRGYLRLLMSHEPRIDFKPTLIDFLRLFNDSNFRKYCLSKCQDPAVMRIIDQTVEAGGEASLNNITPYITSKLNRFFNNEDLKLMVGQTEMSLDFTEMMNSGKVMLVNLGRGRFGEIAAGLLASQIVSRLQSAAMKRIAMKAEDRRDFFLYVDEFQNVASEPFIAMLSEARKFRLGLILANQYADQLDKRNTSSGNSVLKAVLGNVGNTTCFRLGINDAKTMEGVFQPTFNSKDLINLPIGTCYVNLKTGQSNPVSFSLETKYLKGAVRPGYANKLRQASNAKFTISLEHARSDLESNNSQIDTLCGKKVDKEEKASHFWKV